MNKASSELSGKIKDDEMISLDALADLTGFPVETIKEELLMGEDVQSDAISLGGLREAMLKYLNSESFSSEESNS